MKHLLNIGAGHDRTRPFPEEFVGDWRVVRLDFDASTDPDILLDARLLGLARFGLDVDYNRIVAFYADQEPSSPFSIDGAALSHVLEHFTEAEGGTVMAGVFNVLSRGGKVAVAVPNLTMAASILVSSHPNAIVYRTHAGHPIRPVDMLYGWQVVTEGHPLMCHKWGYTLDTLRDAVEAAGFEIVRATVDEATSTELHVVGVKP